MIETPECVFCKKKTFENGLLIAELDYSLVYLTPFQKKFPCRAMVSLKNAHKEELFELTDDELLGFMKDCSRVAKALKTTFVCDKMNYGIAGDSVRHLHMHIVGKQKDGPMWTNMFSTKTDGENKLTDTELHEMAEKLLENL